MTLSKKEISPSQRRQVFRIGTGLGLGALLAACGGGGGGSDSDDSRNLRLALDRLEEGMTHEEIIETVGWQPTTLPLDWDNGKEYLTVSTALIKGEEIIISAYYWVLGTTGTTIHRAYKL